MPLGASWDISWALFGGLLGRLGGLLAVLRNSWASWMPRGSLVGPLGELLGASWGLLGAIMVPSWGHLGAYWSLLGASWGHLGGHRSRKGGGNSHPLSGAPQHRLLGRSWGALGTLLGRSWALLGAPGAILARFWTPRRSILVPPGMGMNFRPSEAVGVVSRELGERVGDDGVGEVAEQRVRWAREERGVAGRQTDTRCEAKARRVDPSLRQADRHTLRSKSSTT